MCIFLNFFFSSFYRSTHAYLINCITTSHFQWVQHFRHILIQWQKFCQLKYELIAINYCLCSVGTLAEKSCFLTKECSKFLTEFDILMGNLFHFLSNMIFYCSTQREIPYLHTSMHFSPPMNLMSSEHKQAIWRSH